MSNTITLPLATVRVVRGRETLAVQVPEHEVDVLRAIHGAENVSVVDVPADERLDVDLNISADAELMRMQAKYKRVNTPDMVLAVFRDGARSLERHGFKLGRGVAEAPAAAAVKDRRVEAKKAEAAQKAEGKKAAKGE